ncbi:hypothetical protein cypCar_00040501 [Cyprinus carpio]|nr:hypothetical protein cypCar_00040501 [Cyprinus carpio]
MESGSSPEEHSKDTTISNCVWKLRRYGRFLPEGKAKSKSSASNRAWKEGFSLLNAQSFLKIQHKSDSLLFNITIKGESRLIRLQFEGSSRAEAAGFCSKAVERLQDYVPVQQHLSTPASAAPADPAEPGPSTQQQQQQAPEDAPRVAPAVAMGPLSIKHLSQYFLGERELSLPMAYHQCTLPSGDLEALLRLCLLDAGFPAFVEEVEKKLKELTQE